MNQYTPLNKIRNSDLIELNCLLNEDKYDFENVRKIAFALYEGLDTPTSLGLYLCLKYNDYKSLLTHKGRSPSLYLNADDFSRDYQAIKFLAKINLPFEVDGIDKSLACEASVVKSERECRQVNEVFKAYEDGNLSFMPGDQVLLERMHEFIRDILGPFDHSEWSAVGRLGPGLVAFGPKESCSSVKLTKKLTVTRSFSKKAHSMILSNEGWMHHLTNEGTTPLKLIEVEGGKYSAVSKTALTYRPIETQPTLNLWFQLAIGKMIRHRLLERIGLDLSDQTPNQRAALLGSIHGDVCTVDMERASDTNAFGPVKTLFESDWFRALNSCRTSHMWIPSLKKFYRLERFSSMGNGFTFELETLIFSAAAHAVGSKKFRVYGDDVVIEKNVVDKFIHLVRFLGYTPNLQKTYTTGPFRESCGADYYRGVPVRPYFLKEVPINAGQIIRVANGLTRSSMRRGSNICLDARYLRAVRYCRSIIDKKLIERIAVGNPIDDSYFLGFEPRPGARISNLPDKPRRIESWHQGVILALYKSYIRELKYSKTDCQVGSDGIQNILYQSVKPDKERFEIVSERVSKKVHQYDDPIATEINFGITSQLIEGWKHLSRSIA